MATLHNNQPATARQIPLTQGKSAIVDEADYPEVAQYAWYVAIHSHTAYAFRHITANGKRTTQLLHRFILGLTSPDLQVDHIDGNGLNNSRSNLRQCSHKQNQGNKKKQSRRTSSSFKGVCWHRLNQRWTARIKVNYKQLHLGYFDSPEDAARAYDSAAKKQFGQFANLNFSEGQ